MPSEKILINDIIGDTDIDNKLKIIKNKLPKIKKKLSSLRLRSNNIRPKELSNFAKSLDRKLSNRGHEPTYTSSLLPKSRPISIPNHPGALAKYTAENILDQFEMDIFEIENSGRKV